MKFTSFEDIIAWQKAKVLTVGTYDLLNHCKDFGFTSQLQRASVSVMNNIAEGYERNGNKEFRNFLFIAKGSCTEVRSMLFLGAELQLLDKTQAKKLSDQSLEISRMLSGLIKTL